VGVLAIVLLLAGGAVWRLSQGTIPADSLRPAAARWLETQVRGGRADVGSVEIAWFGPARSLGLELGDVRLVDGKGRPVLRAKRFEAGLSLASLTGLSPAAGRLAAQDFFAAVSVSPQGRYALGYEASGAPGRGGGDLWRILDDLGGRPRAGRPLSYLEQIDLSRGEIALNEIGGSVSWRGQVAEARFDKTRGRLDAAADMRIGPAAVALKAKGAVGLKRALVQASLANLDPARIFPSAGATSALSILDAPVDGSGWLSWAADQGLEGADVRLTAGQGGVRLGESQTAFHSGELKADFDPRTRQVLIESVRASSDQADFDISGRAWLRPESRATGPARLELALAAQDARLSLAPGVAPAPIRDFALQAGYVPAKGRLELPVLRFTVGDAPASFTAAMQRARRSGSPGIELDGHIDGMLTPQQVVALWPGQLSTDVRNWVRDHVKAGRLGHADFRVRMPPGSAIPYRPMANDHLRVTYAFDSADIAVDGVPLIQHAVGTGTLEGDRYGMAVQSASIEGVGLTEGSVRIPHLFGRGKRLEVQGRARGDARAILQVVDASTSGMASTHGFEPNRLAGQGDVQFSLGRSLEDGPMDFTAAYQGVVHAAAVSDAALGMTLKAPALLLRGTGRDLSVKGGVQLGPYRGPLEYQANFDGKTPMQQSAAFNGSVDGATVGLSGPAGSTLPFAAKFEDRGGTGRGLIRSKAFSGQTSWSSGAGARFVAQGAMNAAALRGVGVPLAKGMADLTPVKLVLNQSGANWTGALDADVYSGALSFSEGATRKIHYAAQLTPDKAQRLGLGSMAAGGQPISLLLDIATTGDAGSASYGLGPWQGQVNWSPSDGARTQYRWRTTLSPSDLHAFGLPSGIDPIAPVPVDMTVSSAGGVLTGAAQIAGGVFRFNTSTPVKGRRRLNLSGSVDGQAIADLGLGPQGLINGPAGVSAVLDLGPDGVNSGHVDADLQRATFNAPFVSWRKPGGRAMAISADFVRRDGGVEVTDLKGRGPGFGLSGQGQWSPRAGGLVRITDAKLEGAFDGSIDLALDGSGLRLTARARYFDARRLLQQGGQTSAGGGAGHAGGSDKPLHLDAELAQVRVSDQAVIHNVKILGDVGPGDRRQLEVGVSRDDGANLVALKLYPDASGMAVSGQVTDVGEAAFVVFGRRSFRGGQATVTGRLVEGGADLHVEMTKVRLVRAPSLARILTVGSLHGLADTLNGAGIEFSKVVAPVSIRGARFSIGRARATGPAMGITTQGVIDADAHIVDLSGDIAPSYVLNSAAGAVPVVGNLLVSRKGEGMFGLTYSARGAFEQPKISVNPFSLATPGILRRIFEEHQGGQRVSAGG
jgi:hypothetical protein